MRLLDRYLLRELFTPLAYCFIGIESLLVVFTIFTDSKIEQAKLSFGQSIGYAAASTTTYLPYVIPVCLLLALLMVLTQHSRNNELTAMRAAGISLWRICVPYFLVGLALGAVLFALDESVVPRSLNWSAQVLNHDGESSSGPKNLVQKFGFNNAPEYRTWVVYGAYSPGTPVMPQPEVDWTPPDGSGFHLYASRAVHTNGVWVFYNARVYGQTNLILQFETNELAMPQFDETLQEIRNYYNINNYLSISTLNPNIPLKDIVRYLRWQPQMPPRDRSRLLTELNVRIATPFTCLVVVFIAIPFGAAPGRRNLFFGVAGSIFICFAYFILREVSQAFGSGGDFPPWLAAWLPNLFFFLLGLMLTLRIR